MNEKLIKAVHEVAKSFEAPLHDMAKILRGEFEQEKQLPRTDSMSPREKQDRNKAVHREFVRSMSKRGMRRK